MDRTGRNWTFPGWAVAEIAARQYLPGRESPRFTRRLTKPPQRLEIMTNRVKQPLSQFLAPSKSGSV
jgi:hypothetical protein